MDWITQATSRLSFETDFPESVKSVSVETYNRFITQTSDRFPYSIGLDPDCLYRSFEQEEVCKVIFEPPAPTVVFPLFGPPELDHYISKAYFAHLNDTLNGRLVHYFHIPGLTPDETGLPENLREVLNRYASNGAVFSCDTHINDNSSLTSLERMLRVSGIEYHNPVAHDTQSYFTGRIDFKSSASSHPKGSDLTELFKGENLQCRKSNGLTIAIKLDLTPKEITLWWKLYRKAFEELEGAGAETQRLDYQGFLDIMKNQTIAKSLAYDQNGFPLAMCCLGLKPSILTDYNYDYFNTSYPQETEQNRLIVLLFLFADREKQIPQAPIYMMDQVLGRLQLRGESILLLLDACGNSRDFIINFLTTAVKRTRRASIDIREAGRQSYHYLLTLRD